MLPGRERMSTFQQTGIFSVKHGLPLPLPLPRPVPWEPGLSRPATIPVHRNSTPHRDDETGSETGQQQPCLRAHRCLPGAGSEQVLFTASSHQSLSEVAIPLSGRACICRLRGQGTTRPARDLAETGRACPLSS